MNLLSYLLMFSLVEYFTLGKLHKDIAKVMVTSAQDESISNKQTIVVSLVISFVDVLEAFGSF